MVTICLKSYNGHYCGTSDASTGYVIHANSNGPGLWEIFQIFRPDGTPLDTLRHNDSICLRTHFGRFVMAQSGGGGSVYGSPWTNRQWETFVIKKRSGAGIINHGDFVTLQTFDGNHFIMATNGGGSTLNAFSTNQAEWKTFSVEFWNPIIIRLKSHNSNYLAAENGGGGEINANRLYPSIWETFRIINKTRKDGLISGDSVAIQVWNGKFFSADNGGGGILSANRNRTAEWETFVISKNGGGTINTNDRVSFKSFNGINYLMALNGGGGVVNVVSPHEREWETFTLEYAQERPMPFSVAPSTSLNGRPLFPPPLRLSGRRRIIALMYGYLDRPADTTISRETLQEFVFGSENSLRSWFEHISYGALTFEGRAIGPFNVSWNYGAVESQRYWTEILTEAAHWGLDLQSFDTNGNGTITGEEVLFLVLDCSGAYQGGQKGPASFNFQGISYDGTMFIAGLYPLGGARQGIDQLNGILGTLAHELCHMILDLPDRYGMILPIRGDVEATASIGLGQERLIIEFISRRQCRLKSSDGTYWVPDDNPAHFINSGGTVSNPNTIFEIQLAGGGSNIKHGSDVIFKSSSLNMYISANLGGGDTVQLLTNTTSSFEDFTWSTFKIERVLGVGRVSHNDEIYLKTSFYNPYNEIFYLRTNPNGRRYDNRGWRGTIWGQDEPPGGGIGGDYDIMDNDKNRGIISAYDRLKRGWIPIKILTPDDNAWYVLRPSADVAEAFVLWDPYLPDEWYVVENRQQRLNLDEIPSNGLIITWINENPAYWNGWYDSVRVPIVISAARRPLAPPNPHILRVLNPVRFYKRSDPATAFVNDRVILPKGDGKPSRFRLNFQDVGGGLISFCIF